MPGTDAIVRPIRAAYIRAYALRGAVSGLAAGAFSAALALLPLRALGGAAWDAASAPLAASLVLAGVVAGALAARRRVPSSAALLARADDLARAGGLFLVADLEGAGAWPKPEPPVPRTPRPSRRSVATAAASLAALAAAFLAPGEWFASAAQDAPLPDAFAGMAADLKEDLAEMREEEGADVSEIAALEEEVSRIESADAAADPSETLDALDRVRRRVDALARMDEAALSRLVEEAARAGAGDIPPEALRQYSEMLDSADSTGCTNPGEEGPGGGWDGCGECGGEGDCEGGCAATGKPSRGRADADMRWTDDAASMDGSRYRDTADGVSTGGEDAGFGEVESGREHETSKRSAPHAPSRARPGARPSGATAVERVSPRHRGTVRRFFGTTSGDMK